MSKKLKRKIAKTPREQLEKKITGALKCCIDAHGPVTKHWIPSATKRIIAELKKKP